MKASTQAELLFPYLLPLIQKTLRGGGGGGSGGAGVGGAPTPHLLSSVHHTGTLSDSQAPQFLKLDGSRTLTGNLSVDLGVTIDGVDLDVHAANPDAHHARATAGNGIDISGQLVSFKPKTTSGMVLDSAGAAVGAGDGIDVFTNTIAVDVTDIIDTAFGIYEPTANNIGINKATHSGLEFISGALAVGTPSSLSVSTTNLVNSATHAHAVTASSDVGTVPAASLLKSTPAGGLGLGSLFTTGAADIGQGFTAGATGLRVIYHTHDYNHVHMVVNPTGSWTLDEQFGLDVDDNLLVRGWIVGKHAIQLAGAKLLAHYDGAEPFELNFKGNPTGHMGQVANVAGAAIYRPGKFGKAVQCARAATNYIKNPSFEVSQSDSWQLNSDTGGALWDRSTNLSYYGGASIRLNRNTALGYAFIASDSQGTTVAVPNGQSVTASVYAFMQPGLGSGILGIWSGGTLRANVGTAPTADEEWKRHSVTWTNSTGGTVNVHVRYEFQGINGYVWLDAFQLELTSYATPYLDGSLGNGTFYNVGHTWSGTANNSTSARTASGVGYLTYGNLNLAEGSFACWAKTAATGTGGAGQFLISHWNVGSEIQIYSTSFGYTARINTTYIVSNIQPSLDWDHIVLTWDRGTMALYVNGAQVDTDTYTIGSTVDSHFWVGMDASAGNHWNGWIDEVGVFDRALEADEITAVYESNAPVFAETSTWHWRAGRNRIFVDAEGMWGYGASGRSIIGLYAGDEENPALTKSWGGKFLSEGDFLLGHYGVSGADAWSGGGWMHFDQDLVSGKPALIFGYAEKDVIRLDSGGASLYGVLDIDTNGGIYQGTGTFDSPTTGLKVWSDLIAGGGGARLGRIGGYTGGVLQWHAGTDGKFRAGGGAVLIDAAGVHGYSGATLQWEGNTSGVLTAGAGNVLLDQDGIRILGDSDDYGDYTGLALNHSLIIESGGVPFGYFAGSKYLSDYQVVVGSIPDTETGVATLELLATPKGRVYGAGTTWPSIILRSPDSGGTTVVIDADDVSIGHGGFSSTETHIVGHLNALEGISVTGGLDATGLVSGLRGFFFQTSTTGAVPVLYLVQSDVSEQFIEFNGTISATNPISNAALGSYYGKVRVTHNGSPKWIALYN